MFGLENKKDENGSKKPFIFELEKEVQNPAKKRILLKRIDTSIQQLKNTLRKGEDQEAFNRVGALLHGYNALLKVIGRVKN